MATDWLRLIQEQGEIAKQMAADVPRALADPDLTLDNASQLYGAVERGAQNLDRIVERMEDYDLDDALFEAAEALQDIWARLSVASANKVRTMQGLSPIEFSDDEEEEED